MKRSTFLATTAALPALTLPQRALAADYRIDGEYDYPGFGMVRSVTFFATGSRVAAQTIAATMDASALKAQIVQGSQFERGGLQLWHQADVHDATIAINGGFFHMNSFMPDGLLVIGGKQIAASNPDYSGELVVDAGGEISIARAHERRDPMNALESGPLLIDPGGKIGMHPNAPYDLFRRSFVAQSADRIVAGITSRISLYELAQILAAYAQAFGVPAFDAALNLGGAASAGFYARIPHDDVREGGALPSPAVILFSRRS